MSIKQDRNGVRKASDVERKYKLGEIELTAEEVEKLKNEMVVDNALSTTSTNALQNRVITANLNLKVTKEPGKSLSTNDFTNEYKNKLDDIEENAQVNKIEGVYINGEELTPTNKKVNIYVDSSMSNYSENPVQNKVIKKYIDDNMGSSITYFVSSYAVSGLSILRSNVEVKNDRVCFNFVGTCPISANTTTTLFNLPSTLRPIETRDFVVFGQSSNNDGYIGYGYVTSSGLLQVRFNEDISSYIRFTAVYDLY